MLNKKTVSSPGFDPGDAESLAAGVTERSDSRRILTPGSFFYVEM
jgi:hypothetical protein